MSPSASHCEHADSTAALALQVLPKNEAAAAEAHIASCPTCRRELECLGLVVDWFVAWPTDVLRPAISVQTRLMLLIAEETGRQPAPLHAPAEHQWAGPDWEQVAPGMECKLLATDSDRHRVSMLLRLAPRANYPPHIHAGVEELHLLQGELWVDGRKLHAGDYAFGAPGTFHDRVHSETGCTCVLVTSPEDILVKST